MSVSIRCSLCAGHFCCHSSYTSVTTAGQFTGLLGLCALKFWLVFQPLKGLKAQCKLISTWLTMWMKIVSHHDIFTKAAWIMSSEFQTIKISDTYALVCPFHEVFPQCLWLLLVSCFCYDNHCMSRHTNRCLIHRKFPTANNGSCHQKFFSNNQLWAHTEPALLSRSLRHSFQVFHSVNRIPASFPSCHCLTWLHVYMLYWHTLCIVYTRQLAPEACAKPLLRKFQKIMGVLFATPCIHIAIPACAQWKCQKMAPNILRRKQQILMKILTVYKALWGRDQQTRRNHIENITKDNITLQHTDILLMCCTSITIFCNIWHFSSTRLLVFGIVNC